MKGFGVELKPTGANMVGRCPFHDDHTPSLIVTLASNLWRDWQVQRWRFHHRLGHED